MEKMITNLDFHQTFKPERICLSNLLTALDECSGKTAQEISKVTGIPTGKSSGKVVPSIYYLTYMGIINHSVQDKRFSLEYTALGNMVMQEDPGIMEELTLLLMHCMISRRANGAELWSYAINSIMPKYHGNIRKDLFEKEVELRYKKKVNLSPFNGTYTGLLNSIGILKFDDKDYSIEKHLFNNEYIYLYALVLYEYWDEWIQGLNEVEIEQKKVSNVEISSDQLEETGFRFPFGWSEQDEYHVLEELHDRGVVSLNRQMVPFIIHKIMPLEEITQNLYSELC